MLLGVVTGCASAPPQPAMVPIGAAGEFGYSERDIGEDRIEVSYIGAAIRVSSHQLRNNSRVADEQVKVHDLALWRGAQIADQRGMAAMKIENEERETDVELTKQYIHPPIRLRALSLSPLRVWLLLWAELVL